MGLGRTDDGRGGEWGQGEGLRRKGGRARDSWSVTLVHTLQDLVPTCQPPPKPHPNPPPPPQMLTALPDRLGPAVL